MIGIRGRWQRIVRVLQRFPLDVPTPTRPFRTPHRIIYAEDELSDDSDETSSTQSARGTRLHVAHEARPRQNPAQSLGEARSDAHGKEDAVLLPRQPLGASDSVFEEDELTDDDGDGADDDAEDDAEDHLQSEGVRQPPSRPGDRADRGNETVESNGNGLCPGLSSMRVGSTSNTGLLGGNQR